MNYRLYAIILLIFLGASSVIHAQYTILPKPIGDESLVFEKEQIAEFRFHTNGFSLGYSVHQIETWYRTKYYYFDIGSLKHAKEYSQNFRFFNQSLASASSRPFVFGKQNRLYALRAGLGTKRLFSEKARKKNVIVGISYEYGFTLGILKPYYLQLRRFEDGFDGEPVTEKYSEENADIFLDETRIVGGGQFGYGLDELKIRPGVHGKIGANFSWGNNDRLIKALEVGLMGDFFLSRVPIMILEENKPYFLNVYITLQIGKRS
jgi:hypothetical protein